MMTARVVSSRTGEGGVGDAGVASVREVIGVTLVVHLVRIITPPSATHLHRLAFGRSACR